MNVLIELELKDGWTRKDLEQMSWSQLADAIKSWDFKD